MIAQGERKKICIVIGQILGSDFAYVTLNLSLSHHWPACVTLQFCIPTISELRKKKNFKEKTFFCRGIELSKKRFSSAGLRKIAPISLFFPIQKGSHQTAERLCLQKIRLVLDIARSLIFYKCDLQGSSPTHPNLSSTVPVGPPVPPQSMP